MVSLLKCYWDLW